MDPYGEKPSPVLYNEGIDAAAASGLFTEDDPTISVKTLFSVVVISCCWSDSEIGARVLLSFLPGYLVFLLLLVRQRREEEILAMNFCLDLLESFDSCIRGGCCIVAPSVRSLLETGSDGTRGAMLR